MDDTGELRDRAALGDLVSAYAHRADRRDVLGIAQLFTEDGVLVSSTGSPQQRSELRGREAIASAMERLRRYSATTHFLGQQTVELDGDRATGETYCLAHHVSDGTLMVMAIRYQDRYARTPEGWRFEERRLEVDWTERRTV